MPEQTPNPLRDAAVVDASRVADFWRTLKGALHNVASDETLVALTLAWIADGGLHEPTIGTGR